MTIASTAAMMYPTSADPFGDWQRDVPWKRQGVHFVTTYSRRASDGKHQTVQVRVRRDLFNQRFAAIDIASILRFGDYCDRTNVKGRPLCRRRRG